MNRRNFIGLSALAVSAGTARGQAAEEKPLLSFGLITDVQYADADPEGERHYRESVPKLVEAVGWLSKQGLPFTLHLGDFIDKDFASFSTVLPLLEKLGHPVRHLLGNHDFDVADGDKARVVSTLSMPADRYRFSHGGVRFVMIDTNDVSTYKHPAGDPRGAEAKVLMEKLAAEQSNAAKPWNGALSDAQLEWLDDELSDADKAGEPVLVCGHHPLFPEEGHQAWNNRRILEVLERHRCVRAYLNGHNHAGAETVQGGIPCVTFKSLLHEPGVTAYSVIHFHQDRLVIQGNGREVSRTVMLRKI